MNTATRQAIIAEMKAAQEIAAAADAAARDLTEEEYGRMNAHVTKAQELKRSADNGAALRKQLNDLSSTVGLINDAPEPRADDVQGRRGGKAGGSVGRMFVESAEYKSMLASVPNGHFGEKARVQSAPFGLKALVTGVSSTSAGALVTSDDLGLQEPTYARPLTVRSLFSSGTTDTDTIEYVRVTGVTNNAAPVAEATGAGVIGDGTGGTITAAAGGLKPESAMALERVSTTVKTIAHWIPATKRSLSDAGQIKTLIDTFLAYGLEEEFEDQLITGSGAGENFTGLDNVSGIQTQAAPSGAEDVFTVTRMARRKVRIGGRTNPTAFVFNPIDWEAVELLRDDNGGFIGAGPYGQGMRTLWGLPVVESEAVAAGTAWCADWRMGVIWDREQASIQVTDSHSDFFVRNLVAILAEMRAAFGVLRPSAFVKIDLAA